MFGGKSLLVKAVGWPVFLTRDLVRPYICRFRQARSGHLLAVEVNSWVGLFAHLEWFLEICLHCERHDLTPCFMSSSAQYVDPSRGPDWFEYFFENLQLSREDQARIQGGEVPLCRIDGIRQLGLPEDYDAQLDLEVAASLVSKYIGIRERVLDKVDGFVEKNLSGRRVLGIHYRGTDKRAEAPPVPWPTYETSIRRYLERNGRFDCLFVSSDEQRFIEFIESRFDRHVPVVCHDDQERSVTGVAVHRSKTGDRYRKAEEAILNCLLLSRCDLLIKNSSFLSAWSKLFNPDLPVTLLNSPFERQLWFPDRALVGQSPAQRRSAGP